MGRSDHQYDIFRDSSLRYLGYANEIGEAVRHFVTPQTVRRSYTVAMGYAAADSLDKGLRKLFNKEEKTGSPFGAVASILDALLWQSLASIVIPGFTINRIVHYTKTKVAQNTKLNLPPHVRLYLPMAAGLMAIPIIVTPIDTAVTMFMNQTTRRIFGP